MNYITLLSDFGLKAAGIAKAKGILLQQIQNVNITDISHDITPFNYKQAAYILENTYSNFPKNTIHIVLIDWFYATNPKIVVAECNGHYFISPDNGILFHALKQNVKQAYLLKEINTQDTFTLLLEYVAKMAAKIGSKELPALKLSAISLRDIINIDKKEESTDLYNVIYIDQYENVVINFTKKELDAIENNKNFRLEFKQTEEINEISNNYNDVKTGTKLCRFNSNGYLEICVNHGKAASLFGLKIGGKQNKIKISFG